MSIIAPEAGSVRGTLARIPSGVPLCSPTLAEINEKASAPNAVAPRPSVPSPVPLGPSTFCPKPPWRNAATETYGVAVQC